MKQIDTSKATADYIGVSESWMRQLRVNGGGPPFIKFGRTVRYMKKDVDAWLQQNTRFNTLKQSNG